MGFSPLERTEEFLQDTGTSNAFKLLLITLVVSCLVWYVRFQWCRRKLYKYSSKLSGPVAYPIVGSAMSFMGKPYDTFVVIMQMFTEYSGIFKVWFGPRCFYATAEPKYYEILLPACLEKEKWYNKFSFIVGEGLFTAPYNKWKKNRKLIAPTFNKNVLNGFVPIFSEQSDILIQQMAKYSGKGEFDLFDIISKCTLDTICETAMGVKVQAQTTDSLFTHFVDQVLEVIFLKCFVWWYHIEPLFNLTHSAKIAADSRKYIREFCGKVVKEKMAAFEKTKNLRSQDLAVSEETVPRRKVFLDYLLDVTNQENVNFGETELIDEVNTFIIAGSDTTATTDCFLLTMLGLHQDFQQRVYDEVMEVIGAEKTVEPEDLPKLKYLERFIKETLRLFPVGGFILRTIDKDVDLGDDIIVPAGIAVVFGILRTHRNEKFWPNPLTFDPDRFLPENVAKRHPCAYIPFSYGPRNCIGPRYAMMAIKSLVVNVVRRYRIFTSYQKIEDIKLKCNLIMRPKDGFKVSIEQR